MGGDDDWMKIPGVSPVPRIVHRPAGVAEPVDLQPAAAGTIPTKASSLMSSAHSSIDVERLTSEVVRSIDRRIIAQRERMGRI